MRHTPDLRTVSDDELLQALAALMKQGRRVEADVLAHIAEVDARGLHAREAASSMFAYCTEVLLLSEHEAYARITAARASREHPVLLTMLRDGRLNLSGIALLARHLTAENRDEVLRRAAGKTHRQLKELVAEVEPKPDVRSTIRKLPRTEVPHSGESQLGMYRVESSALMPAKAGPATPTPPRPAVVEPLSPARYKVAFTADTAEHDYGREAMARVRRSSEQGSKRQVAGVVPTRPATGPRPG